MSGHSKWSNIKRKKAVIDAKKGKVFSKLSRGIMVAARQGGGDPDSNPVLRLAIEKAKEVSMPKENIERAIKKGTGELSGGQDLQEVIYEGFGPGGEAFYIKALTNNKNRTVSEIRSVFDRHGGSLGDAGSTSYIFAEDPDHPTYKVDVEMQQKNKLRQLLEDIDDHEDVQEVYVNFEVGT
jgi:YebC/PmpR family DNA-binding regulatory protein